MISLALAKFLRSNAAITAITQTIEPLRLQADHDDPAIVYIVEDDQTIRTFSGSSTLFKGQCTVDCYSLSYETVQDLASVVFAEVNNYAGDFGGVTAERVDITRRLDMFENPTKTFRAHLSFEVWYTETQP